MTKRGLTLEQRFWLKVDKQDGDSCWLWTARIEENGHGKMRDTRTGQNTSAHRLAYEFSYGPIPDDLQIHHYCDNSSCVRSTHLYLGTSENRFWAKVQPCAGSGCWLWTGAIRRGGYGLFDDVSAHRFSFTLAYGDIPDDTLVCHECDTPLCVRPDHLFLGTTKDNIQDAAAKGRMKCIPNANAEYSKARKLTPSQVIAIKRSLAQGIHPSTIAMDYPVLVGTIIDIKSGKTWRHITIDSDFAEKTS